MKELSKEHVVIIGGGFGGLNAALSLRKKNCRVTLIDKRNFHLFQPLLYQVASGGLSPADIAFPLRAIFKKQNNIEVALGSVQNVDFEKNLIHMAEHIISYDRLIIATGAKTHYFGRDEWAGLAPGLKTVEDATSIRSRVLSAFEKAELEQDPLEKTNLLTFAIIGGGPAGVELAGAIAEISRHTLNGDFKNIDPSHARIVLIEGNKSILGMYPPSLSEKAQQTLQNLGVEVWTNHLVQEVQVGKISFKTSSAHSDLQTKTIVWAAGVQASSLSRVLIEKHNLNADKAGRIIINPDCTVPNYPNVYVIGDMAHFALDQGGTLPGIAPVAMQQGRYVAQRILGKTDAPFKYTDKGNLAVIGRSSAVAFRGSIKISGALAWFVWIFVHLLHLVGAENKFLVSVQWAVNYITFGRSARIIANDANVC